MNDAFEADDREEARAEAGQPGQEEDGEGEQRLPAGRLRQPLSTTSAAISSSMANWGWCKPAAAAAERRGRGACARGVDMGSQLS